MDREVTGINGCLLEEKHILWEDYVDTVIMFSGYFDLGTNVDVIQSRFRTFIVLVE